MGENVLVNKMIAGPIQGLLRLPLNQSRIKLIIPDSWIDRLKILRYDLWFVYTNIRRRPGKNLIQALIALAVNKKTILFYPELPWEHSMVLHICLVLGYKITSNIHGKYDLAFRWKDATFARPEPALHQLAQTRPVINLHCRDISKSRVDQVFHEVFGYRANVDPRKHTGKCVRKSNLNAHHDGVILECPIAEPEDGYVYQILIDNRVNSGTVLDLRVPVYNQRVPFVIGWFKPIRERFTTDMDEIRVMEVSQVFSDEELENIVQFCKKMRIDFAELDILRDKTDGRIYIVDVSLTPSGNPIPQSLDRVDILRRAREFELAFKDFHHG